MVSTKARGTGVQISEGEWRGAWRRSCGILGGVSSPQRLHNQLQSGRRGLPVLLFPRGRKGGDPLVSGWFPTALEGVSPGSVLLGLIVLPPPQFDSSRWLLRPPPEMPRPGTVLWCRVGVCSFPVVPRPPDVTGGRDHSLPFLTHRPSKRECWTSAT